MTQDKTPDSELRESVMSICDRLAFANDETMTFEAVYAARDEIMQLFAAERTRLLDSIVWPEKFNIFQPGVITGAKAQGFNEAIDLCKGAAIVALKEQSKQKEREL